MLARRQLGQPYIGVWAVLIDVCAIGSAHTPRLARFASPVGYERYDSVTAVSPN